MNFFIKLVVSATLALCFALPVFAAASAQTSKAIDPCRTFLEDVYLERPFSKIVSDDRFSKAAIDFLEECDSSLLSEEMEVLFKRKFKNASRNERRYYERYITDTDAAANYNEDAAAVAAKTTDPSIFLGYELIEIRDWMDPADALLTPNYQIPLKDLKLVKQRVLRGVKVLKRHHTPLGKQMARAFVDDLIARDRTNYFNASESDKRQMRRFTGKIRDDKKLQSEIESVASAIAPARAYQDDFDPFGWVSLKMDSLILILVGVFFGIGQVMRLLDGIAQARHPATSTSYSSTHQRSYGSQPTSRPVRRQAALNARR